MLNSPSHEEEVPLRPSQQMLLNLTPLRAESHLRFTAETIERAVEVAAASGDWSTVRTLISRKVGLRVVRDSMAPA